MKSFSSAVLSIAALVNIALAIPISNAAVHFTGPFSVDLDSVHNIHVTFDNTFEGPLRMVYGTCDLLNINDCHHEVGSAHVKRDAQPERFVWIVPEDTFHGGCLHAYSDSRLIGRSQPLRVKQPLHKRQSIADVADAMGPWFNGVAYMQSRNFSTSFVAEAKSKSIAIVGGGVSGLMTSLLLQSVGIEKWHIIESTQRVGGRNRTKYLNNTAPDEYQYQEMGPMRFPVSIRYSDINETIDIQDHKMVFQLADVLNQMNGHDPELAVNFIEWIQSSPNVPTDSNGFRLEDGRVPSRAQALANDSYTTEEAASSDPEAAAAAEEAVEDFVGLTPEKMREISTNIYEAHKNAVENGLFQWSEAAYIRYAFGADANITDYVAGLTSSSPLWEYDSVYFSADSWRTIDKGLSSLARAFHPHVEGKVTYGRRVEGLTFNDDTQKIAVNWREDPLAMEPQAEEYDYAVVAVPFSKVRLWRTPPYSSSLSRAIQTMNYQASCKVALHYRTRFWEHLNPPIIGGCGSTDIPGISSICYPAYAINSTGPGVLLASYQSGALARTLGALNAEDHVSLVQRAMVEVHGDIAAEQYTGIYDRQCWEDDEHQAGAWASPFAGQQDLYLPAYYQTEFNTIFVGEHTSYTHAWIFSALDSAVRGTTQLLLELGLVDEAKEIVDTWMGRWISI